MTEIAAVAMMPAPPHDPLALKEWLSRKEAATYLTRRGYRIEPQTLANLAANNNALKGPPFTRDGWKSVRYRRPDLDTWADSRSRRVG